MIEFDLTLTTEGAWGAGFRPSPYMDTAAASVSFRLYFEISLINLQEYDPPMLVMTYAALLSLAILRDPFTSLDRDGLLKYLKVSQQQDGR
jgi:geranylgeranyl transferase type-1 subunit beta